MNALRHHWDLDPDIVFLNHGSFGATPREVLDYQAALRARIERQPVQFYVRDLDGLFEEAREVAASFVGAATQNFTFVTNATTGVNTVLRSLELQPGDELVVTDHEYNACRNALDFVARKRGAKVVVVPISLPIEDSTAVVEALAAAVNAATRLVLFDHVTSQTGIVFPVARIAAAIREKSNALILVDGAHAPGMVELDVESLGVDYYTGNFHKWVCSPKSGAFLWVRPELRAALRPLVISHGGNRYADDEVVRLHFEFDWQGTRDPTPLLAVTKAIEVMGAMVPGGWPQIRRDNRELALRARAILNEALGAEPLSPDDMIGSLAAVRLPDAEIPASRSPLYLDPLQDRLLGEHRIEVPVIPFPPAGARLLRVSAQLYNEADDYERLAGILSLSQ